MSIDCFDRGLFCYHLKEVTCLTEKMTFTQFSLRPELLCALEKKNFDIPSPVQVQVLKETNIMDEDLIVQAKTGSGKTLAFGLPLLNTLDRQYDHPVILVLSPTRELAIQTARELLWLGREMRVKVATLVGGMDIENQRRELLTGVAIVVGTPGRVLDHIRRGNFHTDGIVTIVLDEGDHMLDLGFREELEAIFESHKNVRRMWLFSATMPNEVRELSRRYLTHPKWISLDQDLTAHEDIKHRVYLVPGHHRLESLINVLLWEAPEKALIFCQTRIETIECAAFLVQAGLQANALHGDMTQRERNASLNAFRAGTTPYLVATDVAARGLDIDMVSHVIQLGLPGDVNNYVHRSGRTGRAGHSGISLALLTHREATQFRGMFAHSSLKAEWKPVPDGEDITAKSRQRFEQKLFDSGLTAEKSYHEWAQALLTKGDPTDLISKLLQWHDSDHVNGFSLKTFLENEERTDRERRTRSLPDRKPTQGKRNNQSFTSAGTIRLSTGTTNGWEVGRLLGTLCRILGISRQEVGNIRLRDDHAIVELSQLALRQFEEKKPKLIEECLLNHSQKPRHYSHERSYISSN